MALMIVEDLLDLARVLQQLLERAGHQVVVATDGFAALERFGDDIEAVISDIHMPGMDGVELARRLRERRPDLPIVFATGSSPDDDIARQAALLGPVCDKLGAIAQIEVELARVRSRRADSAAGAC